MSYQRRAIDDEQNICVFSTFHVDEKGCLYIYYAASIAVLFATDRLCNGAAVIFNVIMQKGVRIDNLIQLSPIFLLPIVAEVRGMNHKGFSLSVDFAR